MLALKELADLAADDAQRAEQQLVVAGHEAVLHRHHADYAALEADREHERGMCAGLHHPRRASAARVARDVGDPQRLPALPDMADQALPRGKHAPARGL